MVIYSWQIHGITYYTIFLGAYYGKFKSKSVFVIRIFRAKKYRTAILAAKLFI